MHNSAKWVLAAVLVMTALTATAGEPDYPRQVERWLQISIPPQSNQADYMAWYYAADYSKYYWHVYDCGQICASIASPGSRAEPGRDEGKADRPAFLAALEGSGEISYMRVGDGWLVGDDNGEFGADLFWYGREGKREYRISNHHIVAFFTRPDGVYAIEGLSHGSHSHGSIIRLARAGLEGHVQASTVVKLPDTPRAISIRQDGSMLITLDSGLVSVSNDFKTTILLKDAPWSGFNPGSSVLSRDEHKLYIGMIQYVAEVDLVTMKVRFLVPTEAFINKLPNDTSERIRKQYSR